MNSPHLLVLGGYGNAGLPLARLLLAHTDAIITLAGRSLEKAQRAAACLEVVECHGGRIGGVRADAADPLSRRQAFDGVTMVVVASSTAQHAGNVARTALAAATDYLDIQYSTAKNAPLAVPGGGDSAGRLLFHH